MKPGEVTVNFEYSRIVGPRSIHGAVILRFFHAKAFTFSSSADWPAENLADAVEHAVRAVLIKHDALTRAGCELLGIRWDDVNSCRAGFEAAARAATISAFVV